MIQAAKRAINHRIERERFNAVLMALRAGIEPDPWQSDLLRSDAQQMILNCTRQGGKSTVTSILGLHTALYQQNSLVLLLSPSLRQSKELFRKLQTVYNEIETPTLPAATQESTLEM